MMKYFLAGHAIYWVFLIALSSGALLGQTVSPDGKSLAFAQRKDIVVAPLSGGNPVRITKVRETGWWASDHFKWSPDSRRILFFVNHLADIRLGWWDRISNKEEVLDLPIYEEPINVGEWIRAGRIVVPVYAGTVPAGASISTMGSSAATKKEKSATVSVLDSGNGHPIAVNPAADLIVIDTNQNRVVSLLPVGSLYGLSVSPDKSHLLLLQESGDIPDSELARARLSYTMPYVMHFKVTFIDISSWGELIVKGSHNLDSTPPSEGSWAIWSPGGQAVALKTHPSIGTEENVSWLRCDVDEVACDEVREPQPGFSCPFVTWPTNYDLLIYCGSSRDKGRYDWWVSSDKGDLLNLTQGLDDVPKGFSGLPDGVSFVGISGDDLVRFDIKGSREILHSFGFPISQYWPTWGNPVRYTLIVSSEDRKQQYQIRMTSHKVRIRQIQSPGQSAHFQNYSEQLENALYGEGGVIWSCSFLSSKCRLLTAKIEAALRQGSDREPGEPKSLQLHYRSIQHEELTAWLFLPPKAVCSSKCPTITIVYAGERMGAEPPDHRVIGWLTAHGYSVLYPSMPLGPEGVAANPYDHMLDGVMPAVDKAVELGIADPDRLGLLGQSYGGYSVYCLVTQTNRFHAAVAMAGPSDLVSLYGIFDPRSRYTAHASNWQWAWIEGGQGRMGGPPWRDPARYIHNSPLFHVENVQTPLMIVQGGLDRITLQQGEEFFTALRRLGKRAEYLRYWDEDHTIEGEANQKDLIRRMYAWYDEFLK